MLGKLSKEELEEQSALVKEDMLKLEREKDLVVEAHHCSVLHADDLMLRKHNRLKRIESLIAKKSTPAEPIKQEEKMPYPYHTNTPDVVAPPVNCIDSWFTVFPTPVVTVQAPTKAAVNAAFDTIQAAGGGTIYAPGGTPYSIDQSTGGRAANLQDCDGVLIIGDGVLGAGRTEFHLEDGIASANGQMRFVECDNVEIADIAFTMDSSAIRARNPVISETGGEHYSCIILTQHDEDTAGAKNNNYLIQRCRFESAVGDGINARAFKDLVVKDCYFGACERNGVTSGGNGPSPVLAENRGLYLINNVFSQFIDTQGLDQEHGMCYDTVIIGNTFEQRIFQGTIVKSLNDMINFVFSINQNGWIVDNDLGNGHILVRRSQNTRIYDNRNVGSITADSAGSLGTNSSDIDILGNDFNVMQTGVPGAGWSAMPIPRAVNNRSANGFGGQFRMQGNTYNGNSDRAIFLQGANDVLVSDEDFTQFTASNKMIDGLGNTSGGTLKISTADNQGISSSDIRSGPMNIVDPTPVSPIPRVSVPALPTMQCRAQLTPP